MSSYILFSQTSTANGERNNWTDAGGNPAAAGTSAPGNTAPTSSFNADTLGPLGPQARLFDISAGPNPALAALGDIESDGAAASALFGSSNTKLLRNNVGGDTIDLAQRDADWNGIKNLEIKVDSESSFKNIKLENFVDTRVQIGDDACLTARGQEDTFHVDMLGVKRGELDGTLAGGDIDLRIDVWSNEKTWQNSFDLKGSVYDDSFEIGAGNVTGSSFKSAPATHDGTGTTVFSNMGAGDDVYSSTVSGAGFKARDKVWGGTGDDSISTGAGDDKIFGDNGSGADAYADPASLTDPASFDFRTAVIPAAASNDFGDFTVDAIGGVLSKVGNASFGGLSVKSPSDGTGATPEIDAFNDTPEAVKITFDAAVQSTEIVLNLFFSETAFFEDITEKMNFKVTLADGSTVSGSRLATAGDPPASPPFPPEGTGVLVLKLDHTDFGGKLIKSIELAPDTALLGSDGKPVSEFVVAGVEYCTPLPGAEGNDTLNAGTGADFVQGDGDTGTFTKPGETCFDFVKDFNDVSLSGIVVDLGPVLAVAGGGTFAHHGDGVTFGGMTVMSTGDDPNSFTGEIDAFNGGPGGSPQQEGVIFSFDGPGVTGFEMDLNVFFGDTGFEPQAEVADFVLHVAGGPDIVGSFTATTLAAPGLFSFDFDTGDTGGKLITGFEIRPSDELAIGDTTGRPYSEFTIAKLCVDDQMISTLGDLIDVGVDADKDTVNFNDGDGFDVVKNFDTVKDVVRMQAGEAISKTVVVDATFGVGTLIEHGADGDGMFLVGVVNTAAITIVTF